MDASNWMTAEVVALARASWDSEAQVVKNPGILGDAIEEAGAPESIVELLRSDWAGHHTIALNFVLWHGRRFPEA